MSESKIGCDDHIGDQDMPGKAIAAVSKMVSDYGSEWKGERSSGMLSGSL